MKVMNTYKFDLDPLTGFLSFERDLRELKQFVKKHGSRVFQDIVQNNIIDNQHGIVAELYPDPTLAQKNTAVSWVNLGLKLYPAIRVSLFIFDECP